MNKKPSNLSGCAVLLVMLITLFGVIWSIAFPGRMYIKNWGGSRFEAVILTLMFGVVAIIAVSIIFSAIDKKRNYTRALVMTTTATVISKVSEISGISGHRSTNDNFFIAFELPDGVRKNLRVNIAQFNAITENEVGTLSYRELGESLWFCDFQANETYLQNIQDNSIQMNSSSDPFVICKKTVENYLLANQSTPFFREKLNLISDRLDVFAKCYLNAQDVITTRFGITGITYDKFTAPVLGVQEITINMVNHLMSKLDMFNEELHNQRANELTQENRLQEAQDYIDLEQQYKEYAEKTLAALDETILKLNKLILEILKLDETDLIEATNIIRELDKTIKDTQYYK